MAPRQKSSTSASSNMTWVNSTSDETTPWLSEDLWPSNNSWSDCCDQLTSCGLENCTEVLSNCSAGNCSATNCTTQCEAWANCTRDLAQCSEEGGVPNLTEFHIIKAVVLVAVTSVLLISVCRMVLQLFVRYTNVKQDK